MTDNYVPITRIDTDNAQYFVVFASYYMKERISYKVEMPSNPHS